MTITSDRINVITLILSFISPDLSFEASSPDNSDEQEYDHIHNQIAILFFNNRNWNRMMNID